ncbi:MAG TPA: YbaK/EbsC family protein [Candidatus Aquilonibacter sp.]|nr:YbaK/EbsC family protein [Candidatus Aquilonibacter sp.]
MPLSKLREFLDQNNVKYLVISHSVAYTAQGVAASAHVKGKELAKTVIVKLYDELAMAVVPASFHVDLIALRAAAQAPTAVLASETEFRDRFPDCELGSMPPFGNLYGMAVYADETLARDEEIAFNAGLHRELVRMAWKDFEALVRPVIVPLAAGRAPTKAA